MQNLAANDFARATHFNLDTKNQLWMSVIADHHDSWCNCNTPFAHLLASIFPPGHGDRLLTIEQILSRDYQELCLSGGADAKDTGTVPATENGAAENQNIKQEEKPEDEGLEELLAAVAAAEKR